MALALGIAPSARSAGFDLDINSREQVRAFYNTVFAASTNVVMNWTGVVNNCEPGTTSDTFKELTRLRVNYYRAMAGVPSSIVFDPVYNAKAQQAALIMSAENAVNHFPPPTYSCYTAEGAEAAQRSNLALGFGLTGPGAIDGYMIDRGGNNAEAGHRRWILFPQTTTMGTGDIDIDGIHNPGNALWVVDGRANTPRPATRSGFVSWPPPGYMPSTIMPVRWSLSYPSANFSAAAVTLSSNGIPVTITKEAVQNGSGENTLVWFVTGMPNAIPYTWARPAEDVTFAVSVSGVSGNGVPTTFDYNVKMFDPDRQGNDETIPTITGPAAVTTGEASQYTYTSPAFATGNDLRVTPISPRTAIEDGENLLANFVNVTSVSTTYSNIVTSPHPVASGTRGFRLAHAGGVTQHITYKNTLLVGEGAELRLSSKLGFVRTTEFAKIQISANDGLTWTDVHSQSGSGSSTTPTEQNFVDRTISLAAFENQLIKVRFNFTVSAGGSTFTSAATGFGWYFDDIRFTNTYDLGESTIEALPAGNQFTFAAPNPGDYMLQTRAKVWTDFAMIFGNVKVVTATGPTPIAATVTLTTLTATQLQITFDVSGVINPLVKLFKASAPNGEWTVDETATFEVLTPDLRYRATIPRPGAATFYRPGF